MPELQPAEPAALGEGLSPADARLALAIVRTVHQRWLTLGPLLQSVGCPAVSTLSPGLQAVLLGAAAQLLFFDRLPARAVVHEAVDLARRFANPNAAGFVNAVLRALDEAVMSSPEATGEPWTPGRSRLPVDPRGGQALTSRPLWGDLLPDPSNPVRHLAAACSLPRPLVRALVEAHGPEAAAGVAAAAVRRPPVFVAEGTGPPERYDGAPVWLAAHLAENPARRVQDPASALAVAATAGLTPRRVLDLCAGRGTKTRQLLATHPDAEVSAWDPDAERARDLAAIPGVDVGEPAADARFDLVLLDVPCTNTGVLARRPEARYRWSARRLASLVALQREILTRGAGFVAPGGHLLYSTCSVDPAENQEQAAWLLGQPAGARFAPVGERLRLPGGVGEAYADGSYHSLFCAGSRP
ncbi:transcription antitermination factor NusB [Phycisphaera mikurensis]|uniref:Putative RNA methyltransferase n=1 Tax=Phycisphaera mikurensis (strain NBRC 102666 / KCTC 22515 / FYK2301M01) TaxID=1142394 RepID=I0IBW9_PHYMF|nr:transcription antitermination factor NusB [Phycisphaera mikurensis]MBB6442018.1 16S rRNA (cytosine967-C5)-methyltransferase [Phycisphaera mikurensis]BAM02757.1 putative RNA methyltransferase [Phycisphaera mikurensis NBRC 102666]